jgi:hypothetical protein
LEMCGSFGNSTEPIRPGKFKAIRPDLCRKRQSVNQ